MVSKAIRCALFGAALSMLVAGAASADDAVTKAPAAKAVAKPAAKAAKPAPKGMADEVAVMETSKGRMVAEFWEKDAPKTVANFKKLARQGFFDGTGFHRIIKGFMIQGGDPNSKNPSAPNLGTGGPGYTIADEFNSHPHVKGVLSMANTGTPNSAGSQFFVMHGTASSLDGHYTAFGHLIAGMDVLDKIANSQTGPNPSMPGENSKPIDWTTLKSVKIMPRNAWQATAASAKKAEASKPAEGKATEMKSSMGGGTGMDMKAAGSTPAASAPATSSTDATGHPGHDTVEKAKEVTQPTTPSTEESGK
jgi:peptidyl-prolyl cis-trans isomerase B (cyclophilin B)